MNQATAEDRLVELRRALHRRPEPAWCEFYTTARIVEECRAIGVDELYVGPDAINPDARQAVPDDKQIEEWYQRALGAGADEEILERLEGGNTGAVAVVERGDGPTIGLRVDIDGLPRGEADDDDHLPAKEGFRSENEGAMHACGHDAHATFGIGALERIAADDDFSGTLKVFFQPAEERIGGGRAMAESEHIEDVDYLYAVHVGLDHPTGEVVAGINGFLSVAHFEVDFYGEPAHAGGRPNEGVNANQALAAAVQNLYAIPRHEAGGTRVNAGVVEGGTASNIIAEHARIVGEVRGETTALRDYMEERATETVTAAADMHGCEVETEIGAKAPSAESDDELVGIVGETARELSDVDNVIDYDELGGSEDATFLMDAVQDNGGLAAYLAVGTDHPGGHHTATFDVDEKSLPIGVAVLTGAIKQTAAKQP